MGLVASLCRPFPWCFRREHRHQTLAVLAGIYCCYIIVRAWSFFDVVPPPKTCHDWFWQICWAVERAWLKVIPLYTFWSEGIRFGIRVEVKSSLEGIVGKLAWMTLFV